VHSDFRTVQHDLLPGCAVVHQDVHASFDTDKELLTTAMGVFSPHFRARHSMDEEKASWLKWQCFSDLGSHQSSADVFEGGKAMNCDTLDVRSSNRRISNFYRRLHMSRVRHVRDVAMNPSWITAHYGVRRH
jgi:hypothetical protein